LSRLFAPGRSAQLLLLTDGEPSVGPESEAEFSALAKRIVESGPRLHALGLGSHYVPEILEAVTSPSGNGFEHVDGPEGLGVALGGMMVLLFGEAASGVAVQVSPAGFSALQCRHTYPTRAEGGSLRVEIGGVSKGLARRVLFSGPLADAEWNVSAIGECLDSGDKRLTTIPVTRVWPDSPEGQRIRAAGLEIELVTAESQAWMALARRELPRAEKLLGTASTLLRQLVALEQNLVLARRHLERLGDLRLAIDGGGGDFPLMMRRARSSQANTNVSQVIQLDLHRPKE
jgi:Ca-activated chloride channel family protein